MENIKLNRVCDELLQQITELYDGFFTIDKRDENEARVQTYWQIGRAILDVEKKNDVTGQESTRVMGRIGPMLSKKYGRTLCRTNMYNMRRFSMMYPEVKKDSGLSWTHYRTLLSIEDEASRKALEEQAVRESLSQRKLALLVKQVSGFKKTTTPMLEKKLEIQQRAMNVYKVVESSGGTPVLDVGFMTRTPIEKGELKNPKLATYVTPADNEQGLEVIKDASVQRFAYGARLERVVNGDTLILELQLHPRVIVQRRFRLRGIRAAEAGTPMGTKATRFVQRRLKRGRELVVHSYATDIHGGYTADIFYRKEGDRLADRDGIHLNRELVVAGMAELA